MTAPLPSPSDLSHLAPCMRCGTMNGVSARWCWRCDATLAQGGPHLPRTVPSVVFDALPEPPPLIQRASEADAIGHPSAAAHAAPAPRFDHFDPPLLTDAVAAPGPLPAGLRAELPAEVPADIATPARPVASPARGRRLAVSGALVTLALVAGVAGYVGLRDAGLPDLNRLPAPAAGPAVGSPAAVIVPPPAPAPIPEPVAPTLAPAAPAAQTQAQQSARLEPVAAPRRLETAAVERSAGRAANPAPTSTAAALGLPRAPADSRRAVTPARQAARAQAAAQPAARPVAARPAAPVTTPPPRPCPPNAAALGLCSPDPTKE